MGGVVGPRTRGAGQYVVLLNVVLLNDRGREVRLSRTPLPPNRTGGFPAYGSPVSRFLWTERTEHGLLAGYRDPDRRSIPPLTFSF